MNHYLPQIQLLLLFPVIKAESGMVAMLAHKIDLDLIETSYREKGIVM